MNDTDHEEEWGPARVQYGDWTGTAAMDEDLPEDLALGPSDEWVVVGIEFYGGKEGTLLGDRRPRLVSDGNPPPTGSSIYALAVPRDEWEQLGRGEGIVAGQRVEVTRFLLHGREAIEVLRAMKRWSIHVTRRGRMEEANIVVVAEGDVGLEGEEGAT